MNIISNQSGSVGIYLHFPYCVHKCSYCDFYSIEKLSSRDNFAEAAVTEIKLREQELGSKLKVETIFFGGGTPSLMKPQHMEQITQALHDCFDMSELSEWTMECNPGTIDSKFIADYKQFGVNRISFGVQSFNRDELKFLERIHDEKSIYNAVNIARKAGFENLSIDLIYAIPGQTLETWSDSIAKALSLQTEHISAYSLIYEPETPLYDRFIRGELNVHDEEVDQDFYELAVKNFSKSHYEHYEISNFAKVGFKCLHNLKYWTSEDYLAYGPSAHGLYNKQRYWNFRDLDKYFSLLKAGTLPIENSEVLTLEQQINERIYLDLRSEGLRFDSFALEFGFDLRQNCTQFIDKLIADGYAIYKSSDTIKLTSKGYFISDRITIEFMKFAEKMSKIY
ncbi:MAG: radical SAM family heme chaperone HemW [Desulfobulbaceae bacterium]|nr:radical SAM family heme chaperone HemW [Desulfobulbaceae bacterium]